eukprot:m.37024 g.37024  ORF g.37024 m.37024 type:complete len:143 (-) comp5425_c0_seq2:344-772(-)
MADDDDLPPHAEKPPPAHVACREPRARFRRCKSSTLLAATGARLRRSTSAPPDISICARSHADWMENRHDLTRARQGGRRRFASLGAEGISDTQYLRAECTLLRQEINLLRARIAANDEALVALRHKRRRYEPCCSPGLPGC